VDNRIRIMTKRHNLINYIIYIESYLYIYGRPGAPSEAYGRCPGHPPGRVSVDPGGRIVLALNSRFKVGDANLAPPKATIWSPGISE
jgi:hypothetical protein